MALDEAFMAFAGELPETNDLTVILSEFFESVSKATGLASVNVAAGIAYNRLTGKE